MNKDKLNEIMLNFSDVYCYIKILKDYCEFNEENCDIISPLMPLLDDICKKFSLTYNKLDVFEKNL